MKTAETLNKGGKESVHSTSLNPESQNAFFSGHGSGFFNGLPIQAKLRVGAPDDRYEVEANAMADRVMRMPEPQVQRKCTACEEKDKLHRKPLADAISPLVQRSSEGAGTVNSNTESSITGSVGSGSALPDSTRSFMESRFGTDFSGVNIHTGSRAQQLNTQLGARAFTYGNDIFFNRGEYNPSSQEGKHLLAHELTHVVQQHGFFGVERKIQREDQEDETRPISTIPTNPCGINSNCPDSFCTPFPNRLMALDTLRNIAPAILAGVAIKVSPRVVGLWSDYLYGGTSKQNLSSRFGSDFTNSITTLYTTEFLINSLIVNLSRFPVVWPDGVTEMAYDINQKIPGSIREIGDPSSLEQMDFNVIGEIPGNIAGGIGLDQTSCKVGAKPSDYNDSRTANGVIRVIKNSNGTFTAISDFQFTVIDTIDLCPGNCGSDVGLINEQIATIPLSRLEASGVSGDVPFEVNFPAPRVEKQF